MTYTSINVVIFLLYYNKIMRDCQSRFRKEQAHSQINQECAWKNPTKKCKWVAAIKRIQNNSNKRYNVIAKCISSMINAFRAKVSCNSEIIVIYYTQMIYTPEQKFTVDMMQTPLFTSVVGTLLSFVMYFRKKPNFRQYLLRLLLQPILIHIFILWLVSPAEDASIPPVPYDIILNIMIFIIYTLGVLMVWLQKKRKSRKMTEQLINLQDKYLSQNQSEDSQSNVTESREPVLK